MTRWNGKTPEYSWCVEVVCDHLKIYECQASVSADGLVAGSLGAAAERRSSAEGVLPFE
jgi:hypothetical protein